MKLSHNPNRLIREKSPYLLQHAYNPVDWYSWGDEAFARARAEDKPVFVSIGYSTCHWCHVMERESFEDEEVAAVLNRYFVAVKVDREERPDVDNVYMSVCQALTGQGGWPLTVIMTPDKKPFFAGTYFPKRDQGGRPGLLTVLTALQREWRRDRAGVAAYGEKIARTLAAAVPPTGGPWDAAVLTAGYQYLQASFDHEHGGFGGAPKFPTPQHIMFLLRYWRRSGAPDARRMAEQTLAAMRRGGIYDHLGGGFARYATDAAWQVPHFEKMLYDNALLAYAYTEAFQCTGEEDFARVAQEIAHYVLRDMTAPEGGFYAAEDADSEGEEGKFYVWRYEDIMTALGPEQGQLFAAYYGVTAVGNFTGGTNILHIATPDAAALAAAQGRTPGELREILAACRQELYRRREARVHPFKDDKILTAWNGLMIAALAKAARVFGRPDYADAAARAVRFIDGHLRRQDGRLLARYRDGAAAHLAYLDDYACLLWALVEMYETTFDVAYLVKARALSGDMRRLFWDEADGGFFFTGADGEELLTRPKEWYDGAVPSGNSVAALALVRLSRLLDAPDLAALAEAAVQWQAPLAAAQPAACTFFLAALDLYLTAPRQVVIAGRRGEAQTEAMLAAAGRAFRPDAVVLFNDPDQAAPTAAVVPRLAAYQPRDHRATAYICQDYACQAPVTDAGEFAALLETRMPAARAVSLAPASGTKEARSGA